MRMVFHTDDSTKQDRTLDQLFPGMRVRPGRIDDEAYIVQRLVQLTPADVERLDVALALRIGDR
jgi:hypothetical protein